MRQKSFILILFTMIILTGCSDPNKYYEYRDIISERGGSVICPYKIYPEDNPANFWLSGITIEAYTDRIDLVYTLAVDGAMYKGSIATFNVNSNGEIKNYKVYDSHDIKHNNTKYMVYFTGFNFSNFFDQFKNNNYSCPNLLRALAGDENWRNQETQARLYDADYGYGNKYYNYVLTNPEYGPSSPSTPEPDSPGNSSPCGPVPSDCYYNGAVSCKKYYLYTDLDGDVTIELGRHYSANGVLDEYFYVKNRYGISYNANYQNYVDSSGATIGSYTYMIRAVDWKNLFIGECDYVSEDQILIDTKDITGSVVAHITTKGSSTLSDYDMFGEPDKGKDRTMEDPNGSGSEIIVIPKTEVEEIYFCESARVLKAFKIIGILLFFAKIIVPLIIIIMGIIDFAKAVFDTGEKANKEAVNMLVKRFIIGILIFLMPTIIDILVGYIDGATETAHKYKECTNCLFNPFNSNSCKTPEELANGGGNQPANGGR